jgi:hypothetical protein
MIAMTEAERESLRPFLSELYEMACAFAMVEDGKVTVGTGSEQRTMTISRMERRLLGLVAGHYKEVGTLLRLVNQPTAAGSENTDDRAAATG